METPKVKRCVIYTRKSTNEGLEQEFNTLDAQREAAEAYILSQRDAGWVTSPERYDDGGFSGGNTNRPAFQRLLADIQAGLVECIVVYKVDRLSRSLLDFARIMELFDQHQVGFVAVTQQINTASSAGRLMLNVLLSFAQFERELISERTRDKMGAARRKGKWLGSSPVLGYDADRLARRLIINQDEAECVRHMFELYLASDSLLDTLRELRRRVWRNKAWQTKGGVLRGGREFTRATLQYLLTNVTYLGKVRYRGSIYAGEHEAILSGELFDKVQRKLKASRHTPRPRRGPKFKGLLHGRLYCGTCQSKMLHTYTSKGKRRYRYYICGHARQTGHDPCRTSIPAAEIERYIREQTLDFLGERHLHSDKSFTEFIDRIDYHRGLGDLKIQFNANGVEPHA